MAWASMEFKQTKSRSLVLKKGIVIEKFCLKISRTIILSLKEKPVKCLGKIFNSDLKDINAIIDFKAIFSKVDKSGLPDCFKA